MSDRLSRRFIASVAVVPAICVLALFAACSTLSGKTKASGEAAATGVPRIAYVVYQQSHAGPPGPTCAAIRLAQVKKTRESPVLAGIQTLAYVDNDDGVNEFRLSPSGKLLLAAVNTREWISTNLGDLWLISIGGKKRTVLRRDHAGYERMQWSSDESRIIYVSNAGVHQGSGDTDARIPMDLYVQNLSTRKRSKLLGETSGAEWIPKTHFLVATSSQKAGLLLFRSGSSKPLAIQPIRKGGDISIAPNAARLAWVTGNRLRVFDLPRDSKRLTVPSAWRLIGTFDLPARPEEVAFSPDGKSVACIVLVNGMAFDEPRLLVILDPATRQVRVTGLVNGVPQNLRWSRDGRYLQFAHTLGDTNPPQQEIAAVPVFETAAVPISVADWHTKDKAKLITLLQLPAGVVQVDWREAR